MLRALESSRVAAVRRDAPAYTPEWRSRQHDVATITRARAARARPHARRHRHGRHGADDPEGPAHAKAIGPDQVWGTSRSARHLQGRGDGARRAGRARRRAPAPRARRGGPVRQAGAGGSRARRRWPPPGCARTRCSSRSSPASDFDAARGRYSARDNPWVRAMPNTPCVVGEGMTASAAVSTPRPRT